MGGISRLFILRPVATTLLMLALLLAGLIGYRALPVSALPEVDYPTIQVVTLYPGAGPDLMTSIVTAPLERQFGQMPGLKQMSSQSSAGASVITLQFQLSLALDIAEQEVQAAINTSANLLPRDLPYPPTYNKVNPADAPILTFAVTSDSLPMTELRDLVENRISQKIAQVNGVGLVSIAGGERPAIRIRLNPNSLVAYGLDSEKIRQVIDNASSNSPKGSLDGPSRSITLSANDQLRSPQEYRQLIVAYQNQAPIRLQDIATVEELAENNRLAAWNNDKQAIIINIQRQPGANVINTADNIRRLLPNLTENLPKAVSLNLIADRTESIRASIHDVEQELFIAIALVVMVIYVFLRNLAATIIPSIVVPLSLIGTFAVMFLLGFSINNLTLMAMIIATGFVVDDAIVVIENISRYIEQGDSARTAALKGAGEIGFTIISLTLSLVAVLIPLLFMSDVIGRLFREFAITLAIAILISGIISLTLTPMMCAKLLTQQSLRQQNRFSLACERFFSRLNHYYGHYLTIVLRHPKTTLLVAISTLFLTIALYIFMPKGFFPLQDNGLIQGNIEFAQSSSFQNIVNQQHKVINLISQDPDVENISTYVGVDGNNASLNSVHLQIKLKPLNQRKSRTREIINRLQQQIAKMPSVTLFLQPIQDLTIEDRVNKTQYQFTLQAMSNSQLAHYVPQLIELLKQKKQLVNVSSDWQDQGLVAYVNVNRDLASRLGINMADIDNVLYNAFGQRLISTIYTQSNQYRVILEYDPHITQQSGLDTFNTIYIKGKIPLSSIATIEQRNGNLALNRLDQLPATTIAFDLADGVSLGEAINLINQTEKQLNFSTDITTKFQGATLAFKDTLSSTIWLIIAAIITMYIVLGILYESFIHPITILSTLPTAGVGALLALMIAGKHLDIIAIIGIILLIGIVKKNAIMMIDFAIAAEREQKLTAYDAIYKACLLRFRPILMTTLAALLGALPLMLSFGVGSELRQPLGICMVGGLMMSQLLTLFTTPVIYLLFDRWAKNV